MRVPCAVLGVPVDDLRDSALDVVGRRPPCPAELRDVERIPPVMAWTQIEVVYVLDLILRLSERPQDALCEIEVRELLLACDVVDASALLLDQVPDRTAVILDP